MLFALDLGNTNLTIGAFDGDELAHHFRLATRRHMTADEYWLSLYGLLQRMGLRPQDVQGAVLASVVPEATAELRDAAQRLFGSAPLVVDTTLQTGLRLNVDKPSEVGADRIVDCLGALSSWQPPLIVVDLGTATSFDVIDKQGAYIGGAIAPGVGISTDALFQRAAKLHPVALQVPEAAIGRDTERCLQSGIVLGFAGLVDTLVRCISRELPEKPFVVATGGLSSVIGTAAETVEAVDPYLTLRGLREIWRRCGAGVQA